MSDNIKVVVKVRPLISREIEEKLFYQWRVKNDTLYQIDQYEKDVGPYFTFDKVYDKDTKTSDVYNDIAKPIVEAATAGFNGTIFAYGQTSSGKTYTMTGTEDAPGIIPLAVLNLFELIKNIPNRDFLVRVSFVEIYNETLIDLLNIEKKIKIQDTLQGVKVDATEKVTSSPEEVLDAMKEGKANRQTAATNMNEESSRSHSIFQITIESREHVEGEEDGGCVNVSQLNLVDLAGSERAGQTGATGLRFKEGTHINKSLSSLALVIKQLSDDPTKHVNYRDSKLTRILQNSLGGNAKTSIICAITPAAVEETISTLQFANRAKSIKNKPAVNAVTTNATMIQQLTRQLSTLKTELENKKSLEKDNYTLQKQIAALQRLILNGFGQRSTAEILNPRRKLVQPRRVTISTLHSIQEDPTPAVPKFCTPSLKYNPLVLPGASDFQPIHSALSLPTLPEEPPRLVTPPLKDRKVNFQDEIIELDSDDDCSPDAQTCPTSPYHKCYESSKTPPCVLRRNAKRAEKNLQDIVELTGREKIYMPDVVEVMEKLDQNSTVIANLEDEISKLRLLTKDKDFELDKLKSQINRAEEDIKMLNTAKVDLENRCKDYHTKLTDSEVSYETLKKKAKLREEELLSLIEEQKPKNTFQNIGKALTKTEDTVEHVNLLETSHNISLVNSESEQSVISIQSDLPQIPLVQLSDLQEELSLKNIKILELEALISAQENKMMSLESISKDYETNLDSYKEKLIGVEKELSKYKSTAEALNKIVEAQQSNIDSVNNDIESYKKLIQELQLNLQMKDNINNYLNDKELEYLVENEATFIANNENIKNVIQCLKIALQTKNEEIKSLKAILDDSQILKEEIVNKNSDVISLANEIQILKRQAEENVIIINKLLLEKKSWSEIETQLNLKLTSLQESINELTKENDILSNQAKELKVINEDLNKKVFEQDKVLENYDKQSNDMLEKIANLEKDNLLKDKIIASYNKTQEETEENLSKAKLAVNKVQDIVTILSGNIQNVPDIIDNFMLLFNTLNCDLATLENIATGIKSQKEELLGIIIQCEKEHAFIEKQIDEIIDNLNNTEINSNKHLEENFTLSEIDCHYTNEILIKDLELQEGSNYTKYYLTLNSQLNKLVNTFKVKLSLFQQKLLTRDKEIYKLNESLSHMKSNIEAKDKEIDLARKEKEEEIKTRKESLKVIFEKSLNLKCYFKSLNNIPVELLNSEDYTLESIVVLLDEITDHIKQSNNKYEQETLENALMNAKMEIQELTEQNLKFLNEISRMETTNVTLSEDLNKIRQENQSIAADLENSSKLLELLRQDLQSKVEEIENMEIKAKEWKVQFVNLDFLMKEQMHAIRLENNNLKTKYINSRLEDKFDNEHFESDSNNDSSSYQPSLSLDINNDLQSPQSLLTLCCNKIIDSIEPNESKTLNRSSCSDTHISETTCQCDKLDTIQLELQEMKDKNVNLESTIEKLQTKNQNMFKEYNEIQNEVKSLLDVTYELQKKVVNHRTNLSTLTAMTYAENKSLSSQIKFLQHHHNRFHNVCQRDIPAFKKQLQELMTLLKNDNWIANDSIKRYSLPNALDSSTIIAPNFKNESTLDGDLLMLDTNLTLTTTADTTLVGHDHTYFDVTQVCISNEVACQTDLAPVTDSTLLNSQISVSLNITEFTEKLEDLKKENNKLREMVNEYSATKVTASNEAEMNKSSPKLNYEDILSTQEHYIKEIEILNEKLSNVESEKCTILEKYNNLQLEIPSTDALIKKITALERNLIELESLRSKLNSKNKEITALQEENDSLSTQVMEAISEVDDLKKEHDNLKVNNLQLSEKCSQLQIELETLQSEYRDAKFVSCHECELKSKLISTLEEKLSVKSHARVNRSFSDSDRTSSYNTICTLQSELHAGKEDCNTLKEEVTTIKNHLERSNLTMAQSMDLDENMGEANIFPYTKDFESVEPKCTITDGPEDRSLEIYTLDKLDCLNYFAEVTGANKDIGNDVRIVDVMKMLYNNLLIKHGNEIENLINKIRDFEASKTQLTSQVENINKQHLCKTKELQDKSNELETIEKLFSAIRCNTTRIAEVDNANIVSYFKETILNPLDIQFKLNSTPVFESVINNVVNRFIHDLDEKTSQCCRLEEQLKNIHAETSTLNINLTQLKSQLTEKENECELLKRQKEKIQEISNAVTLDIVKKEQDLNKILSEGCNKLSEQNILDQGDIERMLPLDKNIDAIFQSVVNYSKDNKITELKKQNNHLMTEVTSLKMNINDKDSKVQELTQHLHEKENHLLTQKTLLDDINEIYRKKVDENNTNLAIIQKMNEDINNLRQSILTKETTIETLKNDLKVMKQNESLEDKVTELLNNKQMLKQELDNVKLINQEIIKEKDNYAKQLEESSNTIKENKIDLEALTSEILILKESVKENFSIIENLKQEVKSLIEQNSQVKENLQEKIKECSRLETNIKTHEKTAEIQSRMIMRLQKQKEEDIKQKEKQIEELKHMCEDLQNQCASVTQDITTYREELQELRNCKLSLEEQISELQEGHKSRPSLEVVEGSRRRRQSIHDSKRMFADDRLDADDHTKMEAVFGARTKNDDFFMDVDGIDSNRSTPMRRSKGRDSSQCKHEQEEEGGSRPSSVAAARRRRQSAHDLHRASLAPSPRPDDHPRKLADHQDFESSGEHRNDSDASEVSQLRRQLASCQEELEELREKYKELDDECETCAQYLRERDDQCLRLKREKAALEQAVSELKAKLSNPDANRSARRTSLCDAAVNTDEDWANLHSVVVDRMSYDAEVEKNKKLTKTIEELRFKKQDLKNTMTKMQKALEKKSSQNNRELETIKSELSACKEELEELKERYKELDEECDTCAQYLRERDEQCRKLKEAKNALEAKLKEYEEDASSKALTVRKKRQSLHDQNRLSASAELVDVATETSDDFLSYQVEKDNPRTRMPEDAQTRELKRLRFMVDKVSQQKAALEQQLLAVSAHAPLLVATGSAIVQNQQLTDVMKENQKLKKMNARLINICKKRGKTLGDSNRENQDPSENV